MNEKEIIIAKILSDAEARANAIKSEGEKYALDKKAETAAIIEDKIKAQKEQFPALDAEIMRRRMVAAELDVKKEILRAKVDVVEDAYSAALSKLRAMKPSAYLKLIEKMLSEYAEDKDVVIASKADKDIVTEDFVAKFASKKKINLGYSSELGDFAGGIVLRGKSCDKNLSLEVELDSIKDDSEENVSAILFGKV